MWPSVSKWARPGARLPALAILIVASLMVLGWIDRSQRTVVQLGDSVAATAPSRLVVVNSAGPVSVRTGETTSVAHNDSWLFGRPQVELETLNGETLFRVRCQSWGPCRSSLEVVVTPGTELLVASTGFVNVDSFDGLLTVLAETSGVSMGPIMGSVRVVAHGDITGTALRAIELDVATVSGSVKLDLLEPADNLLVSAGPPGVVVELPEGEFAVWVEADGDDVEVDVPLLEDDTSGPSIVVRSAGPVVIKGREVDQSLLEGGS